MPTAVRPAAATRAAHDPEDLVRTYLDDIGRVPLLTAEQEVDLARRIEAGVYADHLLRGIPDRPEPATPCALEELEFLAQDGRRAKETMVRANLRLVVSVARKYTREAPLLDLVQEGNLGLIRAVEKFDYAKGFKFSTYATWWIRQAVQRALPELVRTVRLPVHAAEAVASLRRAERNLVQRLDREPSPEEVAAESGLSVERVLELRRFDVRPMSLDAPVGDEADSTLVSDLMRLPEEGEVGDAFEEAQKAASVRSLLNELPAREARLVTLRFGLDGHEPRTLDAVGRELGLTRERVRQLEKLAIEKLRGPAAQAVAAWAA